MQNPLYSGESSPQGELSPAQEQRLISALTDNVGRELRRVSRQRLVYMGLNAFVLVFFAILLFISARRYHDFTLWGVGVCLMIFALIEFLELDFNISGKSLLDFLRPKE